MVVKGKVSEVLALQTGISKAGKDWQKQDLIVDNGKEYNNLTCITFFGDKVGFVSQLVPGQQVEVSINVSSRKYLDNWYNSIDGWKVEVSSNSAQTNDGTEGNLPF